MGKTYREPRRVGHKKGIEPAQADAKTTYGQQPSVLPPFLREGDKVGEDSISGSGLFYIDKEPTMQEGRSSQQTLPHVKAKKGRTPVKKLAIVDSEVSDVNPDQGSEDLEVELDYVQNVLGRPPPCQDDHAEDEQSGDSSAESLIEDLLKEASLDNAQSNDEEFCKLVQEYKTLLSMGPDGGSLEWTLDEEAARIMREKKYSSPHLAAMPEQDFNQIINFEEAYGVKKKRRGAKTRCDQLAHPTGVQKNAQERGRDRQSNLEINFKQLNRDIKLFARHEEIDAQMEIKPYPPMIRRLIHELAHIYGLRSRSNGAGADRHCVLVKSKETHPPRDLNRLDRFLEGAQKACRYAYADGSGKRRDQTRASGSKGKASSSSVKVTSGSVVGSGAVPIEDDNIGNKMLRKLGWSPGQGLGTAKEGRTEPVAAIFKGNRTGLGH